MFPILAEKNLANIYESGGQYFAFTKNAALEETQKHPRPPDSLKLHPLPKTCGLFSHPAAADLSGECKAYHP